MYRRTVLLALGSTPLAVLAQRRPVLQVSVLAEGILLVDGSLTTLAQLDEAFARLKSSHGIVWYYREGAQSQPPATAVEVVKLIQKHALPVSLSSRPDFSDYIDANGKSWPRTK